MQKIAPATDLALLLDKQEVSDCTWRIISQAWNSMALLGQRTQCWRRRSAAALTQCISFAYCLDVDAMRLTAGRIVGSTPRVLYVLLGEYIKLKYHGLLSSWCFQNTPDPIYYPTLLSELLGNPGFCFFENIPDMVKHLQYIIKNELTSIQYVHIIRILQGSTSISITYTCYQIILKSFS